MSYANLPPGACYVPEMHLETYWLVKYADAVMIMADDEFVDFADRVKYEGVEYEATVAWRTREYYESLPEARL